MIEARIAVFSTKGSNCMADWISETEKLLNLINSIADGDSASSIQSARRFYDSGDLAPALQNYIDYQNLSKSKMAENCDISPQSINRILAGGDISENMLFRLKRYLEKYLEFEKTTMGDFEEEFFRKWRLTDSVQVQEAISNVSLSLTALHKTVLESNQVGSENSVIGPLQKAQLVALLESMLSALKAPAVDTTATGGFFSWLGRIAKRGAEKGLEKGISDSLGDAIDGGEKLLNELASQPAITDLDKLV